MAAQCATEVDDNPLWNFALAFYASKDAQQCLLTLQNDHQQDTLLVLVALWLAGSGESWQLEAQQLDNYLNWQTHIIWSLRTARKAIPKENDSSAQLALRQRIQQDEIRAEQLALHQLFCLHTPIQPRATSHQQTLNNLFAQAGVNQQLTHTENRKRADIKKEALEPLFQQLANLLANR